jgi:hypothetical protein
VFLQQTHPILASAPHGIRSISITPRSARSIHDCSVFGSQLYLVLDSTQTKRPTAMPAPGATATPGKREAACRARTPTPTPTDGHAAHAAFSAISMDAGPFSPGAARA